MSVARTAKAENSFSGKSQASANDANDTNDTNYRGNAGSKLIDRVLDRINLDELSNALADSLSSKLVDSIKIENLHTWCSAA